MNYNEIFTQACRIGDLTLAKALLDKGVDIHIEDDEPLRLAASHGNLEVVKLLIKNGADIHADNNAALRCAIKSRHHDIVELLFKYGADTYIKDEGLSLFAGFFYNLSAVDLIEEYKNKGKT